MHERGRVALREAQDRAAARLHAARLEAAPRRGQVEGGGAAVEVVVEVDEEGEARAAARRRVAAVQLHRVLRVLAVVGEARARPRAVDVRPVDGAAHVGVAEAAEVAVEPRHLLRAERRRKVRPDAREERLEHSAVDGPLARRDRRRLGLPDRVVGLVAEPLEQRHERAALGAREHARQHKRARHVRHRVAAHPRAAAALSALSALSAAARVAQPHAARSARVDGAVAVVRRLPLGAALEEHDAPRPLRLARHVRRLTVAVAVAVVGRRRPAGMPLHVPVLAARGSLERAPVRRGSRRLALVALGTTGLLR